MSSKIIGLVKWFNEDKGLALSPHSMEVKMFLFTLLAGRNI
jgi:cold shock CspA family protein